MAMNFEFRKSSDILPFQSTLAPVFEDGVPVTFLSWKIADKENKLELTFKSDSEELIIARFNDPTAAGVQPTAAGVILSQLMELAMEMGDTRSEADLHAFISSNEWDATLFEGLFDSLMGVTGRGKLAYQASFVEYDAEAPEVQGLTDEQIKGLVAPFIGFGRFPFFYKDGNPAKFKPFVDKKNQGKYSDHVSYIVRPKKAAGLDLGGAVQGLQVAPVGDDELFK